MTIFFVDDTKFEMNFHESDTINIKSYNKTYEVIYNQESLEKLIKNEYKTNDFIIIDKNVHNINPFCTDNTNFFIFNAFESTKTIDSVLSIVDVLLENKFSKVNKLIVIGGGITQDVGGFVSAIYKRGVDWVFIPTTVLSMTDSAIGSKVSINYKSKNILGLFRAPNKIIISDYFLVTLQNHDIISGLGESLKLSLIGGIECYKTFRDNYELKNYLKIIKLSSCIKKEIIEYDELELNERRVLNYGHTFGHALESASNYFIPHGIAVLYGMYMINKLFYGSKYNDINNFILDIIPQNFKKLTLSFKSFIKNVLNDKKNQGNRICFILLDNIGKSIIIFKQLEEVENDIFKIFKDIFQDNE